MVYALWDLESANLIETFASEEAALEEVRLTLAAFGREAVLTWGLNFRDQSGHGGVIATGVNLIARAVRVTA